MVLVQLYSSLFVSLYLAHNIGYFLRCCRCCRCGGGYLGMVLSKVTSLWFFTMTIINLRTHLIILISCCRLHNTISRLARCSPLRLCTVILSMNSHEFIIIRVLPLFITIAKFFVISSLFLCLCVCSASMVPSSAETVFAEWKCFQCGSTGVSVLRVKLYLDIQISWYVTWSFFSLKR